MDKPILRYDTPPTLVMQHPMCHGCDTEVASDGDGFLCRYCGTSWPYEATENEPGTSYADWSGDDSDLPLVKYGPQAWLDAGFIIRRHEQS